jgi:AraC-like DNA-binding protein
VADPREHLLSGYLGAGPAADAVVVRAATPPRIVRKFRLGAVGCCLFEGDGLDAAPAVSPGPPAGGLVLGYVAEGELAVDQDGHTTRLAPGGFVVYTPTSPFRVRAERRHRYLVVRVPFALLGRPPVATRHAGSRPSSPLLSSLLQGLAVQAEPSAPASAGLIADATAACLHAVLLEGGREAGVRSRAHFARLTRWIDAHLPDGDLSAATVARNNFLSPRYVRRIFADAGTTVSGYVRDRRLDRIRQDLLDPVQSGVRVSELAARWGYREPSVFGRAFARRFGDSPERYRKARLRDAVTSER